MSAPRVGSLFAGIGGFDLGLESAGMQTAWQIELDPFRRRVLELRFPEAERFEDVKEATGLPPVDVLAGGFPCQDLSAAGRGAGIDGERSGLWSEFARLIGEQEPNMVLIENVPLLLSRGFDRVLEDLCELGFSVEWDCLPAAAFGAPHLRDRVWVVAHRQPEPLGCFGSPAQLYPTTPPEGKGGWRRWPRAGFAQDPDAALELAALAPVGRVKRGLVDLWPTPHGFPKDGQARNPGPSGNELGRAVNNWPTPTRQDGANRGGPAQHRRRSLPLNAAVQAMGLGHVPTPTAGDSRKGGNRPKRADGRPTGISLSDFAGRPELLPTPVADDVKGEVVSHLRNKNGWDAAERRRITSLAVLARNGFEQPTDEQIEAALQSVPEERSEALWPTPRSTPGGPDFAREGREESGGDDLATTVARLLPTPRASDGDQRNRGDLIAHAKGRANKHHPTPTSSNRDSAGGSNSRARQKKDGSYQSGSLNPPWVEWLMGYPCGWTDLDCAAPAGFDWSEEPCERVAENVASRTDRLSSLGDSLVPQIPEWIAGR